MTKIALITGTSSGLGSSLALQLARVGFKVYATMRDLSKNQYLIDQADKYKASLEYETLDVTKIDSVNSCVERILDKEGKIDLLINNAGLGFPKTTEHATEREIREVFDINLMGAIFCTKAVLPSMRKRRQGRIINISSVGGLVGQPFNEIYCAAKFGLEGYTESLASFVQPHFNIHFTLVEPGGISSDFVKNAVKSVDLKELGQDPEYGPILRKYLEKSQARGQVAFQTPDEVAEIIVQCVQDKNPPLRMRTSAWSRELCELKTKADPDGKLMQEKVIRDFLGEMPTAAP